jgi:hypothetical protein
LIYNGIERINKSTDLDSVVVHFDAYLHDISELETQFDTEVLGGTRPDQTYHRDILIAVENRTRKPLGYLSYLFLDETEGKRSVLGKSLYLEEIFVEEKYRKFMVGASLFEKFQSIALAMMQDEIHTILTDSHCSFETEAFFQQRNFQYAGQQYRNAYGQVFIEMAKPLDDIGQRRINDYKRANE